MESPIKTVDVTDRAVSMGYVLPEGWTVPASTFPDDIYSDPRESGDVYKTDIDEDNYDDPAHGFCKGCGKWMHKATADDVDVAREAQMVTGATVLNLNEWVTDTGNLCPAGGGAHVLDDPAAVKAWRDGRWSFVTVEVKVLDGDGIERGSDCLGGVESGRFPVRVDSATGEIEWADIDPLTEPDYPLSDLIGQAMDAVREDVGDAEMGPCYCGATDDPDDDTRRLVPDTMTCGTCERTWCGRCHPTPASRCPFEYMHDDYTPPVDPGHVVTIGALEHEVLTPDVAGGWAVRLHDGERTVATFKAASLPALLSAFAEITSDLAFCLDAQHDETHGD